MELKSKKVLIRTEYCTVASANVAPQFLYWTPATLVNSVSFKILVCFCGALWEKKPCTFAKKRAFRELVGLLRSIEEDRDNIEAVRELNRRLIDLLLAGEKAIARHTAEKKELRRRLKNDRPSRVEADLLRRKIKLTDVYIRAQNDQVYVWKCFGDALAFTYLDPLSIKHMFFDTTKYEVKRGAGQLGGKSGLIAEMSVLDDALNNGMPAILCDLTNTLRFGDICLLGESDPFPIEVKTTPGLNQRGKRQKAKLEELHSFLENDNANDFRGFRGSTNRIVSGELKYYDDALNATIERAHSEGFATCSPEAGFSIACIKTGELSEKFELDQLFESLDLDAPEIFDLNHFKNGHGWAFYLPFLLTIRNSEHILEFL
ncbi:hypothetical protein [Phaeovulum vinaykumarii]|uniref:Uncharacterized protein n=1 Tax=Phaeovulum vinaykumarii TaxID=407234 RepID=A0A1N7LK39_9RHOB|nr:hypothetical protein [Phaeovulum vinaykumarii]SIS74208.1 hypothetical protein SAMN05421795_103150 [Phaeovulum vinaykumarii]SOC04926.1 hypothetical protein SAMN05878426_103150 [Phaeovulum vinaykumarii]